MARLQISIKITSKNPNKLLLVFYLESEPMPLRVFYLLLFLLVMQSSALAQEDRIIHLHEDTSFNDQIIGPNLFILEEDSTELADEEILSGKWDKLFHPSKSDMPNKGLLSQAMWVKFVIQNSTETTRELYLESRYPFLDYITLYQKWPDGRIESRTIGDAVAYEEREVDFRFPVFKFYAEPGQNEYYIRIKSIGTMFVGLFLWTPENFDKHSRTDNLILGLSYGALVILTIYNIFLTIFIRSRSYLYYSLYLITFIGSQFCFQATAMTWIGGSVGHWIMNRGFLFIVTLSQGISLIFASRFLNTRHYMPKWRKVLFSLAIVNFVLSFLSTVADYNTVARVTSISTILTSLSLILGGFTAIYRGFRPAIYYTLAWMAILVGNVCLTLLFNGVIPMSFLAQWGNIFAGVIEVCLMSFALADRIRYTQKRSEDTIRHLNQELTKHIHQVESIVEERTETIRSIVDNVKSGFFIVNRNLEIEAGFTRSCYELLGKNIKANDSVLDVFGTHESLRNILELTLKQVFDDLMPESASLAQIPKNYRIGNRVLHMEGATIRDHNNRIKGILFTLTDETLLSHKQSEASRSSMLLKILIDKDAFQAFLQYVQEGIKRLRSAKLAESRREMNFFLHTLKGNCLVFNMEKQAMALHELEEKHSFSASDINKIEEIFRKFLEEYASILNLSWDRLGEESYVLNSYDIENLRDVIQTFQNRQLENKVDDWLQVVSSRSVRSLLGPIEEDVHNLAKRLDKKVELSIAGGDVKVKQDEEKALIKSLIHLIRNAVIHGIEANRTELGKSPVGSIQIKFEDEDDRLLITVHDDGRGYDRSSIIDKCVEKQVLSIDEAQQSSLTSLLKNLSALGHSSALEAGLYAGRGVGIGAVFQAVAAAEGDIEVISKEGEGTTYKIALARQALSRHPSSVAG